MKLLSFLITICWSLFSLLGYVFWNWDIGSLVFFINIGFLSLGFNYYAALVLITFSEFKSKLYVRSEDDLFSSLGSHIFLKSIGYFFTLVMLTFGLFLVTILTVSIATAYFYIVYDIMSLEEFIEKWDDNWNSLIQIGVIVLGIEIAFFVRQFLEFSKGKRIGWESLAPFTRNSKNKIRVYFFGSIGVVIIDGAINDFNSFGYLSLGWLFLVNILWAIIDLIYPPSLPLPVNQTDENS